MTDSRGESAAAVSGLRPSANFLESKTHTAKWVTKAPTPRFHPVNPHVRWQERVEAFEPFEVKRSPEVECPLRIRWL